jgi:hypothetical protein
LPRDPSTEAPEHINTLAGVTLDLVTVRWLLHHGVLRFQSPAHEAENTQIMPYRHK